MSGRVEAIWTKRAHRGEMDAVDRVALVADGGIRDDANFGRKKRQVTVIEKEVFDRIREDLPDADPKMRRANFMVSGIRLEETRGHVLTLGGVRIRIYGETRPCHLMEEQCEGLQDALDAGWSGGAYGAVLDDGEVSVGDAASIELEELDESAGSTTEGDAAESESADDQAVSTDA